MHLNLFLVFYDSVAQTICWMWSVSTFSIAGSNTRNKKGHVSHVYDFRYLGSPGEGGGRNIRAKCLTRKRIEMEDREKDCRGVSLLSSFSSLLYLSNLKDGAFHLQ